MEFNQKLFELTERFNNIKETVNCEEATKTSMVLPFFHLLGYDVFNPLEFIPEFTADVGIKKGEKVDYAIIVDNKPLILIECKSFTTKLDKHGSQLFRYFGTTDAKFAILTNGTTYQFYTDLENKNRMDLRPFLTVDLLALKDRDIIEIEKFRKDKIDVDEILSSAENLKYSRLIKEWFSEQLEEPSTEFVKHILNGIYDGVKTQRVIDEFVPLVKKSLQQYINDAMNAKIKYALSKEEDDLPEAEISKDKSSVATEDLPDDVATKSKIVTTIEELEAYAIVKSILRTVVVSDRIAYRDTESYFGILLDNNNRKWICRIHIMSSVKYITISDENKKSIRYDIDTVDDIYKYSDAIIKACKRYL